MTTNRRGAFFTLATLVALVAGTTLGTGCAADAGADSDEDSMTEDQLADALSADDDDDDFADPGLDDATSATEEALTPSDKKMFGLGVDAPQMIASPLYAPLKAGWRDGKWSLRSARIVFYADSHGAFDTTGLRTWVDAVKAAGLDPVVGVSVMRKQTNPQTKADETISPIPHARFRARFWKLLREFPDVNAWGVVNEPDLELHGVSDRPKEGALYYVDGAYTLRRCQMKKKCAKGIQLIAGEFSYQGDANSIPFWKKYGEEISARVRSKAHPKGKIHGFPRLWAFHPYADTTDGTTHGTQAFASFLADLESKNGLSSGSLRVWLTETGTLLEHGGASRLTCGMSGLNPNGSPTLQYRGAKAVYGMAKIPRVDRVYWWQSIQAAPEWPGIWDSAMADYGRAPRGSFCALTKQAPGACTGDAYSRHCHP